MEKDIKMYQIKFHLFSVIIGALLLLGSKNALASDCSWEGPFLENIEQADLIVQGKILSSNKTTLTPSPSLEIEILEIYKGTFDNSTLRTINAPFGGIFRVGTEWILALEQRLSGEYIIPECWSSYLKVESSVMGSLQNTAEREAKQRVSLDKFENMLQEKELPPSLINYEEGVQAGLQRNKALYESKNGRLHIPAVNVLEAGQNITYEVTLIQRIPSFIFDLDLNSVKVHQ